MATTTERGYGTEHQAERRRWQTIIDQRPVNCARCDLPIPAGSTDWDLGHNDERTAWTGPEHRNQCNRAAGGRAAHQRMTIREW